METGLARDRDELARTADAAAEHSLLVLETHRIVLSRINDLLRGLSDDDIRAREQALHDQLRRLLPELPLVQTVAVNDRNGGVLLTANVFPVPRDVNINDREWMQALRRTDAPSTHISRVYIGRLDQFLFFAVSRRRTETGNNLPAGVFDGAINISVQPNQLASGFAGLTGEAKDLVALIRADGQILARHPGFAAPLGPLTDPKGFPSVVVSGQEVGSYLAMQLADDRQERLAAFRKVRGYPVYAVAARETKVIVRHWADSVFSLFAVGIPAVAILALLARVAYRRTLAAGEAQTALTDETARRVAAEAAREADARFHAVFESNPNGILAIDRAGVIRLANSSLQAMFGYTRAELIGQPVEMLLPARFRDGHKALRDSFITDPSTKQMGAGRDLYGLRKDGAEIPIEIGLSSFAAAGEVMALAIVIDITERARAAATERMLTRELQHRTNNMLAVIEAIASRSLRPDVPLEQAKQAFAGRLQSLARMNQALIESNWSGRELRQIVRSELEPFEGQVAASGPDVALNNQSTQDLTLALHELATNAVKYGALSKSGGQVLVNWTVERAADGATLTFRWEERGGPPVTAPEHEGFGTFLLRATFRSRRVEYRPEGLVCEFTIELPGAPPGGPFQ